MSNGSAYVSQKDGVRSKRARLILWMSLGGEEEGVILAW